MMLDPARRLTHARRLPSSTQEQQECDAVAALECGTQRWLAAASFHRQNYHCLWKVQPVVVPAMGLRKQLVNVPSWLVPDMGAL